MTVADTLIIVAWDKFRDDIDSFLPSTHRRAGYIPHQPVRAGRVFDEGDEGAGMHRTDRLEMSER